MRNQILVDWEGNILNNFIISFDPESGKYVAPVIAKNEARECWILAYRNRDKPAIIFDRALPFAPLTEFQKGEIIIDYLLPQSELKSKESIVRCDIIEADNALKLRKSGIPYFYKPDIIRYNDDVKYIEPTDNLEWSCECYEMIYKVPYDIPNGMNFKLKEYCFGNEWSLTWNGTEWLGDNIQGRKNPKVIHKCNKRKPKDSYGATGC